MQFTEWSEQEIELLKELNAKRIPIKEMVPFFQNRTKNAIATRLQKLNLKSKVRNVKVWSSDEDELLKTLYPNNQIEFEEMSKIIGRSIDSIKGRAYQLKLKRKAKDKYDLTGMRFGRLLVLERSYTHKNAEGKPTWKCICDCQLNKPEIEWEYIYVVTADLRSGRVQSCGCLFRDTRPVVEDLTGMKFGRLTVIKRLPDHIQPNGDHVHMWLCECDCDQRTQVAVSGSNLKSGNTRSCGCYCKEQITKFNKETKHKRNKFEFCGNIVKCYAGNTDDIILLDVDDYYKIEHYYWTVKLGYGGYKRVLTTSNDLEKETSMAKIITGVDFIDHWDRNPLNNTKNNLRPANPVLNSYNRSKVVKDGTTSQFIGVSKRQDTGKWRATISTRRTIKYFNTELEALLYRLQAEHDDYGIFAPQWYLFAEYGIDDSDLDYWAATFANPEVQEKYGYKPSPLPTKEEMKKHSQSLEIQIK